MLRSRTNYYGFKYLYTAIFTVLMLSVLLFFDKYESSTITAVRSGSYFITDVLTWPVRSCYKFVLGVSNDIKRHFDVASQNKILRQMILEQSIIKQKLRLVIVQNEILKQQLNLVAPLNYNFITARLRNLGHNMFTDNLVIEASYHNLRKNQPVVCADGLLGRIYKINGTRAKVLTINDTNSSIPVIIQGKDIKAICKGNNSGKLSLIYQDQKSLDEINIGDEVITSGSCGIFPMGLIIGKITSIDKGIPTIKRPINVDTLHLVRILQDNYA